MFDRWRGQNSTVRKPIWMIQCLFCMYELDAFSLHERLDVFSLSATGDGWGRNTVRRQNWSSALPSGCGSARGSCAEPRPAPSHRRDVCSRKCAEAWDRCLSVSSAVLQSKGGFRCRCSRQPPRDLPHSEALPLFVTCMRTGSSSGLLEIHLLLKEYTVHTYSHMNI